MFVWVTPNATKSNWIYFESGYVYSRNIKVVPIGFDGIKLEELPAPLNILQGFNINSPASLNNIIAVINREFGLTFPDIFDETFFEEKILKYYTDNSPEIMEYVEEIKCIFHPRRRISDTEIVTLNKEWMTVFENVLREKGEAFTQYKRGEFFGVGFKTYARRDREKNIKFPEFLIDPLALNNIWEILADLNSHAYDNKSDNIILIVQLNTTFKLPEDNYLISSRLLNTEVDFNTLQPHVIYKFRNIQFRINILEERPIIKSAKRKELVLIVDHNNKEIIPLVSLIKLLVKQRVIRKDNVGMR